MSLLKFGDAASISKKHSIESGPSSHISGMYAAFGKSDANKCGDCAHFRNLFIDGTYKSPATGKCIVYETAFPGRFKGWKDGWSACGKFEAPA